MWRYSIDLEPGEYLYKYIIDAKKSLISNSNITVFNGEVFNVRVVKEPYSFPKTGDGRVKEIYFRNERRYINPVKPGEIYLAIEFEKNDIEDVNLQSNAKLVSKEVIESGNNVIYRFHVFTEAPVLNTGLPSMIRKRLFMVIMAQRNFF